MKKSDLRDGMVVEYDYGNLYLILNGKFIGKNGWNNPDRADEETLEAPNSKIVAVYMLKMDKIYNINNIFDKENLMLIWKREGLTNWGKVDPYTKVLVRDGSEDEWKKAYFIKYIASYQYKFKITFNLKDDFTGIEPTTYCFKYCKLYMED